jgi:TRAP-type mannitol/chloroaromatic compound transport system permease small subunit
VNTVSRLIDGLNTLIGRTVCWLVLLMVLVQFSIVVLRYVFGIGSLAMYELVVYMHGLLFMMAAAYTLAEDGHVRVDIFYRGAAPRTKALVNIIGVLGLLVPTCVIILYLAWPYVIRSWSVLEGSRETSGLPGVFLFKTVILLFASMLLLQGISIVLRATRTLLHGGDDPGAGARVSPEE